jgi:prepilin-type N-terminal cleavage/methylation domain-containing protein
MVRRLISRTVAGVTLIELLVVIAVVAVLVALVIPSVRGTRRGGRDARSLTRQRETLGLIVLYTQDHKDAFPYLGTPGDPLGPIMAGSARIEPTGGASYFRTQMVYWASALVPTYCPSRAAMELGWGARKAERDGVAVSAPGAVATPMWLTQAAHAGPEYFATPEPLNTPAMFRGTRTAEVAWPSAKGLTVDITAGAFANIEGATTPNARYPVGMADGSASMRTWAESAQPVMRAWGSVTWPVIATPDGVRGRDYHQ